MKKKPNKEYIAFLRKQCAVASCSNCSCKCKKTRRGCGSFTPTAKFYDEVRAKFNGGLRSQPVPVQAIAELAVSMKSGGLVNKRMEQKAV